MKRALFIILLIFLTAVFFWRFSHVTTPRKEKVFTPTYEKIIRQKNFIEEIIFRYYPQPQADLLSGMLVGSRAQMSPMLFEQLQITGTLHVIALSGTNISFLISSLIVLAKLLGKKQANIFSIFFIIGFILFVGPSPSVVRAGIMGIMLLVAELVGKSFTAWYALFLTGFAMFLYNPDLILDLSFQLSFLATLGLVIFSFNDVKSYFKNSFKATVAAQIFTMPLILYHFGRISLVSFLTNVLVAWLISYIMIFGFLAVFLSISINKVCEFFNLSCSLFSFLPSFLVLPFVQLFLLIINVTSQIPFASFIVSQKISLGLIFLYYSLVFFFTATLRVKVRLHPKGDNKK